MYCVTVRDHIMIAHSFRGEVFGPAQRLHGATFVVEAEFRAPKLDPLNLLVDIAAAKVELRHILDGFDYRNLDAEPVFAGQNTTTEYLCLHIHRCLSAALADGRALFARQFAQIAQQVHQRRLLPVPVRATPELLAQDRLPLDQLA